MQTSIDVQPVQPGRYEVVATEGLLTTRHQVTVSPAALEDLGLAGGNIETVLRETFAMLLEREPATSVPARVSLEAIGNCYPDFWPALRERVLGARSGTRS